MLGQELGNRAAPEVFTASFPFLILTFGKNGNNNIYRQPQKGAMMRLSADRT